MAFNFRLSKTYSFNPPLKSTLGLYVFESLWEETKKLIWEISIQVWKFHLVFTWQCCHKRQSISDFGAEKSKRRQPKAALGIILRNTWCILPKFDGDKSRIWWSNPKVWLIFHAIPLCGRQSYLLYMKWCYSNLPTPFWLKLAFFL